jgi:hypothetical protein
LADLVQSGHLDGRFLEQMPVLDVRPDRCYEPELLERYQGLLGSAACDGDADRQFTLVWQQSEAVPGHRQHRQTLVDQVPADCFSHPTYVPVPASP